MATKTATFTKDFGGISTAHGDIDSVRADMVTVDDKPFIAVTWNESCEYSESYRSMPMLDLYAVTFRRGEVHIALWEPTNGEEEYETRAAVMRLLRHDSPSSSA